MTCKRTHWRSYTNYSMPPAVVCNGPESRGPSMCQWLTVHQEIVRSPLGSSLAIALFNGEGHLYHVQVTQRCPRIKKRLPRPCRGFTNGENAVPGLRHTPGKCPEGLYSSTTACPNGASARTTRTHDASFSLSSTGAARK